MKKLFGALIAVGFIGSLIFFGTVDNAGRQVRKYSPSAEVTVYQGHSPDAKPEDMLRVVFGSHYVATTEWLGIVIRNESKPVNLSILLKFHVGMIQLEHCKVTDLSMLSAGKTFPFIEFRHCDLSRVPPEQKKLLRSDGGDNQILHYGDV